MLTVGSLFSGIGGLDLGLERAGMRIVWQCEADPYCRAVLRKHWPTIPCYEDVRTLASGLGRGEGSGELGGVGTAGLGEVQPVEVLAGGFPCQPVSLAGARRGAADIRWLWPEFARLIRLLRPRYALMENVPGLLVGGGMAEVLRDLAESGYDAEWDCVAAANVGAPHLRFRVFIVAYPRRLSSERWGKSGELDGTPGEGESQTPERERIRNAPGDRGAVADADRGRLQERKELDGDASSDPADRNSRGRHADGLRDEVAHTKRSRLEERQGVRGDTRSEQPAPERNGHAVANSDPERRYGRPRIFRARGRGESSIRGQWLTEPDVGRVAHGVPSRVDRLRALGNAVVPQVAEYVGRQIVTAHLAVLDRSAEVSA